MIPQTPYFWYIQIAFRTICFSFFPVILTRTNKSNNIVLKVKFWSISGRYFCSFYCSYTMERKTFSELLLSLTILTAVGALRALIDFTLSNARRFYSSMANPLAVKGLRTMFFQSTELKNFRCKNKETLCPISWLPKGRKLVVLTFKNRFYFVVHWKSINKTEKLSAYPSRKKYRPCNFRPVNNFAVFPLFEQSFDMSTDPYFLVKVWYKRNLPNFFLGPLFVQPMVSYYPCKRRELWAWRKKLGSLSKNDDHGDKNLHI